MKYFTIIATGIFTLFVGLSSCCYFHDDDEGSVCFEFDQRQCGYDEWAELIPISDSEQEREQKMKDYLESKNIKVNSVNLVINFHEAVCEACGVCPEEDRFFVKIDAEDQSDFENLDLLNSSVVDCGDAF